MTRNWSYRRPVAMAKNTRGARLSQLGGRRNHSFRGPVHNSGSGCAIYLLAAALTPGLTYLLRRQR